jgi:hypothetical protein
MNLPKLCFLSDFPIHHRRRYQVILNDVFKELKDDVQKTLQKNCEIFVLGYKLGAASIPNDKYIVILNTLAMNMEDERVGKNIHRDYHILAHELAHVYLGHKVSNISNEKAADELAKDWGFEKPN